MTGPACRRGPLHIPERPRAAPFQATA